MKICVVGNGPSAEGHGADIDACDFVVRMKAFWRDAAEHAGEDINAWAWFGHTSPRGDCVVLDDVPHHIPPGTETWFTQCLLQITNGHPGIHPGRIADALRVTAGRFYLLSDDLWELARKNVGSHPSMGFMTVCMALDRFPDAELLLYGFDSTGPDKPNYWDARGDHIGRKATHNVLSEKRVIANILDGEWLGEPTQAKLIWPDMPELQ